MHDPTEHVQEHIQHTAAHGEHHDDHAGHGHDHSHNSGRWITAAALTAAILAALAAISGMLSNSQLTNSTHNRIDANDEWSYYQADSIKSALVDTRMYEAKLAHQPSSAADIAKKAKYEKQLPDTKAKAEADVMLSEKYLEAHETFESAETLFHISIAVVAIAVVAKRRAFWYMSLAGGAVGAIFFTVALGRIPAVPKEAAETQPAAVAGEKPAHVESPASAPSAEPAH